MQFLTRNRVGAILRAYAKAPDLVETQGSQVLTAALRLAELKINNRFVFGRVMISIPIDTRRKDHDCGQLAAYLRSKLPRHGKILINEVRGDVFCATLNDSYMKLAVEGCRYATMLSSGAIEYLTENAMEQKFEAFLAGAKVASIAIDELQQSILEGRVANTAATWDIEALGMVGGFDMRAAQAYADDRLVPFMRGWNEKKGEVFYELHGVEEIIPVLRLVEHYGECIAPIMPTGSAEWIIPDSRTNPEGYAQHLKKMGTKFERQAVFAASIGFDLSFIKSGVMQAYRHPSVFF